MHAEDSGPSWEQALGQLGLGTHRPPTSPLLFPRLPEGRAGARSASSTGAREMLIRFRSGLEKTPRLSARPAARPCPGGPTRPPRTRLVSRAPASLAVCRSEAGGGPWAALVSAGCGGGPGLSCPELSSLCGQAGEAGSTFGG